MRIINRDRRFRRRLSREISDDATQRLSVIALLFMNFLKLYATWHRITLTFCRHAIWCLCKVHHKRHDVIIRHSWHLVWEAPEHNYRGLLEINSSHRDESSGLRSEISPGVFVYLIFVSYPCLTLDEQGLVKNMF